MILPEYTCFAMNYKIRQSHYFKELLMCSMVHRHHPIIRPSPPQTKSIASCGKTTKLEIFDFGPFLNQQSEEFIHMREERVKIIRKASQLDTSHLHVYGLIGPSR